MTALGLGLAALGRPGYITLGHGSDLPAGRDVDAMRDHAHRMLDLAWACGVRHLDAARSYGRAEEFLGSWLRRHPGRREQVTVGSKWGYTYVAGWQVDAERHEIKDHSVQTLVRQWEESLEALGGAPAVYVIHSVTPDSPALGDERLLGALAEIARDGVRVGISTSGPEQAAVVTRALELGATSPFSAVQSTWNLLESSCGPALAAASRAGWHVALKETVANGRLTPRSPVPAVLDLVSRTHHAGPDAISVAAALSQPATVALVGAATPEQLQSNRGAVDLSLTDEELAQLATLAEEPAVYWSRRSELAWN